MATIKITAEDLAEQSAYLLILESGVVQWKDTVTHKITDVINPSKSFGNQLSAGGRTARKNQVEQDVTDLLDGLKIQNTHPEGRYLAAEALSGKQNSLRAYIALTNRFRPDTKTIRPVQRVFLSDAAFKFYLDVMIEGGIIPDPYWSDEGSLDTSTDNLAAHDVVEDDDEYIRQDIRIADAISAR